MFFVAATTISSAINFSLIRKTMSKRHWRPFIWFCCCTMAFAWLTVFLRLGREDIQQKQDFRFHRSDIHFRGRRGGEDKRNANIFVISLCRDNNTPDTPTEQDDVEQMEAFERQLQQAAVLIKSTLALTAQSVTFLVATDTSSTYDIFKEYLKQKFPQNFKSQLRLENLSMLYPDKFKHMKTLFKLCSTLRLFIPSTIRDLKAVVYLDTDLIFMRPPEDLWNLFQNFGSSQIVGMAPCLSIYNNIKYKMKNNYLPDFPYYGSSGINAGVLMMNLSRLAHFPGGWIEANMKIYEKFKGHLKFGDQDILNALFSGENEKFVYEIGCDWNFRHRHCVNRVCPTAHAEGISMVHGTDSAFFRKSTLYLKVVFHTWKEYELQSPLKDLKVKFEENYSKLQSWEIPMCSQNITFDGILLKRLNSLIDSGETGQK